MVKTRGVGQSPLGIASSAGGPGDARDAKIFGVLLLIYIGFIVGLLVGSLL